MGAMGRKFDDIFIIGSESPGAEECEPGGAAEEPAEPRNPFAAVAEEERPHQLGGGAGGALRPSSGQPRS